MSGVYRLARSLRSPWDRLPAGGLGRNAAKLMTGTAVGQLLLILASPVLSRMYGPGEFGALAVYSGILSILTVAASLRYEAAIPVAENDETAKDLLVGSLLLAACVAGLVGLTTVLIRPLLRHSVPLEPFLPFLWILPVGVWGAGTFQAANAWAVRTKAFGDLARTRIGQNAVQVGIQLAGGVLGLGGIALLLGDAVGRSVGGPVLLLRALRGGRWRRPLGGLRRAAIEYRRYPAVLLGAGLLNIAALNAPLLLLPAFFGVDAVGSYFFAYRIVVLPASLLGAAAGQVFFGEAAALGRHNPALRGLVTRVVVGLLAVNLPVYAFLALLGPKAFAIAFGSGWESAGAFAQILAPMVLVWSLANPLSPLLVVGDRLKESLAFTVVELAVKVAAILGGGLFHSLRLAVVLLSIGGLLLSLVSVWRFTRVSGLNAAVLRWAVTRIIAPTVPLLALAYVVLAMAPTMGGLALSVALGGVALVAGLRLSRAGVAP